MGCDSTVERREAERVTPRNTHRLLGRIDSYGDCECGQTHYEGTKLVPEQTTRATPTVWVTARS